MAVDTPLGTLGSPLVQMMAWQSSINIPRESLTTLSPNIFLSSHDYRNWLSVIRVATIRATSLVTLLTGPWSLVLTLSSCRLSLTLVTPCTSSLLSSMQQAST